MSRKNRVCPNRTCPHFRQPRQGNIIRHSFYKTSQGRRRRYRCKACGRTFSSTYGTAYYRLQRSRAFFDSVATMSVNGVGKSAIARISGLSRSTVCRWLEVAFRYARHFNSKALDGYELTELQADEIRTFVGSKQKVMWLFTALEVSSRLWVGLVVGSRSYTNVKKCLFEVLRKGRIHKQVLFTTDGFDMYRWFAQRYMPGACIHGQVIKKRRKNRVTSVRRSLSGGTRRQLDYALFRSEDSSTLNTSFVERHNLTIRQSSSYLGRRTAGHARAVEALEEHLELLQLHYNFMRPHLALRFGAELRTPAMQAGLAHRKLSFRDVFAMSLILFLWGLVVNWARSSELWWRGGELRWSRRLELGANRGLGGGIEIQQHLMRQAPSDPAEVARCCDNRAPNCTANWSRNCS